MAGDFSADVLICGAGASGLTLAIDLARRGVSFQLIDKLDGPFQGSRGKGVQPRTLEVFEDLGVVDRIAAAGGFYPPQREYRPDGSTVDSDVVELSAPDPGEPYGAPLMVAQFRTEAVLRERLAELGHAPRFGCTLQGFEQDEAGVSATIATPEGIRQLRLRYLVGADGGRSFVRHALDIAFPGKTLGVRAVVADVLLSGVSRDVWHRYGGAGMEQQIALCPLVGTDLFQLQAPIPLEGDVDLGRDGLNAMVATRTRRNDIQVDSVLWASAYSMNARLADHYRVGRVLLMGDAAHIHPPTGGQGLNTSVQDAYNLGWKLAATLAGAPALVLDSYESERRAIAGEMLGLTTGLLGSEREGPMKRGREAHQLDLGYPDSPLNLDVSQTRARSDHPDALRPGDRVPDVLLHGAGGQDIRLFALLKGPHWTAIGYHVDAATLPPRAGLHLCLVGDGQAYRDQGDAMRDSFGLTPGEWVLVRPDGYACAIVGEAQAGLLIAYLDRVLLPH